MTAALAEVAPRASPFPLGHRISAGLRPEPGAYSTLPAWWSRESWVDDVAHAVRARADVTRAVCAVAAGRAICREEHVDPDTLVRVARTHASYADDRTGRNCRPTNERLAVDLQMSVRQIQRARRVLKRLLLLAETQAGRSIMTRDERLRAWGRGSSARRLAATFALTTRRAHPQACRGPVDHVTPPGEALGSPVRLEKPRYLGPKPETSTEERRSAPRSPRKAGSEPSRLDDVRAARVIAGVQERVPWLRAVSPRRLSAIRRLARHGWTPRDVVTAMDDELVRRGWRVPKVVERPAAYVAALLREVDPADRPGAIEAAMLADELRRREWVWQTSTGRPCEHGTPGGDSPHPALGHVVCLECRRGRPAG